MKNFRFQADNFTEPIEEAIDIYNEYGFVVLENMIPKEDCHALKARMTDLINEFTPDESHTTFSTVNRKQEQNDYFLSSGDKIRFFFENDAFDAQGKLKNNISDSLNKVGHALHDKDVVFNRISRQPRLKSLAERLGLKYPKILQSMYIFKPPRIGGEVICHQDAPYLWTEPQSCMGFWIALEVKQGTLIAFDGQFPHLSGPNTSDKSRHAYTLHLIDGTCDYPAFNWLQLICYNGQKMTPLKAFK